jgi:hypothetical protein
VAETLSRRARAAVTVVWGLAQLAVVAGALFAGAVAGAGVTWDLLPALTGVRPGVVGLPIGTLAGVAAGVAVTHNARGWLRTARLRHLRRRGTHADARVVRLDRRCRAGPRGGSTTTHTMVVRWADRRGTHECGRRFRFIGAFRSGGDAGFATRYAVGATVPVAYRPERPARAVLDIPYAPMLADLLP